MLIQFNNKYIANYLSENPEIKYFVSCNHENGIITSGSIDTLKCNLFDNCISMDTNLWFFKTKTMQKNKLTSLSRKYPYKVGLMYPQRNAY